MGVYIGSKLVKAIYMTRGEYNRYRGWQVPADEDENDVGVLVEYLDGGKPNDSRHEGYISWSPKDVFDRSYRPVSHMSFGLALEALKMGKRVARQGWNGKGMWLLLIKPVDGEIADLMKQKGVPAMLPWIGMKTADEKFVPWLASQTDMLADDWVIVQ